ncbi:hypothetical protein [Acinetobacter bereziniae]|uniref:hypothetical protein n=1 Tax=Acinetobacter bereziniae TaxID=106648 RepID=UPI000C2C638C|nr:hypothetical protein [Acinetobacter bereziniae]ATZ63286.1 hypothetical protein BSR55_07990 [Acinetobacter bereziniae]MBJ8551205.1 hypothetical protein [Acinetobacter bereziniae]
MDKTTSKVGLGLLALGLSLPVMAGITLGSAESETGALTLSGTIRVNYQNKDYGEEVSDKKVKLDAAILRLAYESPDWFGKTEYRCYQYDTLCDFSTLVYGYAGYRLSSTDYITLGLQPIPFGPSRFWDSSFFASINNTMGLQDIHNLGVNYHFEMPSATKVDLAYFATDGGNYQGESRDSARYSANMVKSYDPLKTNLQEKNMWMARVDQDLKFLNTENLKISAGASYWYSQIENHKTTENGSRNTWALFNRIGYKNFNMVMTGGRQSITNKDDLAPNSSGFGSFDSEYDIANQGYFYTIDSRYRFNNIRDALSLTPYLVLSGLNKKQKQFENSQRNIAGLAWEYKNATLYTEYLMSKNDPFVGGRSSSLAKGDDSKWNKLLNLMLVYNF